ncbi:MAG: sn-glycerol-3-phosphate ABC transporter ATP-binding protein UgpC [Planctomycetes bacterium]|nr:sn-glycerol-3-phosphate ABC transporter ATP-binding protein UgpC [Planctomycetota bacterium]
MATLSLRHVAHAFGSTGVLEDVSLEVADGEFLVLLGPSGCGKSTLLRIVAGLVSQSAGEVWIDGVRADELEPKERQVALVFQNYALYPHMTVRANLAFPLKMAGLAKGALDERVERAAEVLGLTELLARKPAALSGGQMQRVALGRALVREPKLFLFDEPLSNLDAKLRAQMRLEIARLVRELGTTALYVTHDQAEAMTLATRLAVLRAGKIEQLAPPLEVYQRPATSFVASFVGHPPMNLVRLAARAGRVTLGGRELFAPLASGEIVLGIRPQDVVAGGPTALPVRRVERLGGETHVHLALGEQTLVAAWPGDASVPDSGALAVELPLGALHWFDAESGARLA